MYLLRAKESERERLLRATECDLLGSTDVEWDRFLRDDRDLLLATDVDRERLFLDLDLERDFLNLVSETELDFFLRVADFDLDFLVFTTDLERDFLTRVIDFERDRFFLVVDLDLDFLRSFDRECERADLLVCFEGESRLVDVDREFESSVFNKDLE